MTKVIYPQKVGTIMANTHPGSYCGQDAYNDMFIVYRGGVLEDTEDSVHRKRTVTRCVIPYERDEQDT